MTLYNYHWPWVVWDYAASMPATDRVDGILKDPAGNTVPTFDETGAPAPLRTGASGVVRPFQAEIPRGVAHFGEGRAVVISDDAFDAREQALAAAADAAATRAAVERLADNAQEIAYFYRDAQGSIWLSATPVLVGGGVPRINEDGDPVVVFQTAT